jgi:hypothetical protein
MPPMFVPHTDLRPKASCRCVCVWRGGLGRSGEWVTRRRLEGGGLGPLEGVWGKGDSEGEEKLGGGRGDGGRGRAKECGWGGFGWVGGWASGPE